MLLEVKRARNKNESGAAMVELALAVPLLIGMILFSIALCRGFADRNRMLAGSRTISWVYTHIDDPENFEKTCTDNNFPWLIRAMHFKERGVGAGVVRIGHSPDNIRHGLFLKDGKQKELRENLEENAAGGTEEIKKKTGETVKGQVEVEGKKEEINVMDKVGGMFTDFLNGLFTFLIGDFQTYRSDLEYGMPLIFKKEAYELFWGEMRCEALEGDEARMGQPGATYAFLSPGPYGQCVMPVLDEHAENSFGNLMTGLNNMMGLLEKMAVKVEDVSLYRPYEHAFSPDNPDEFPSDDLDTGALYALLVYEIEHKGHKDAKNFFAWYNLLLPEHKRIKDEIDEEIRSLENKKK